MTHQADIPTTILARFTPVLQVVFGLFFVFVIAPLILIFVVVNLDPEYRNMIAFEKEFRAVSIGTSKSEVTLQLGAPDRTSSEFRIGQEDGFEDSYARAAASGAVEYWSWNRWVDVVFTVGFDPHGSLVVAEFGGT